MKRLIVITVIFLLSLMAVACSSPRQETAIAKPVNGDPYVWDFGQVKEGQILKHDFAIRNGLSNPLVIKKIDTSCSCTVSEVKKKTLMPGESTVIEVKFNSKGYFGPVQQFVYVNTDNTDNPVLKFTIKANVEK
jgi:GTPase